MHRTIRRTSVALAALAGLGVLPGLVAAAQYTGHGAKPADHVIVVTTAPAPPRAGDNRFTVTVRTAAGAPVLGADVTIELVMPAMPAMRMPEMRTKVSLNAASNPKRAAAGTYTGSAEIAMAGQWTLSVRVTQKDAVVATHEQRLTVQ